MYSFSYSALRTNTDLFIPPPFLGRMRGERGRKEGERGKTGKERREGGNEVDVNCYCDPHPYLRVATSFNSLSISFSFSFIWNRTEPNM